MVGFSEASEFLCVPYESLSPNQLQHEVKIRFVQHYDAEFFDHGLTWYFLQDGVDAVAPSCRCEAVVQWQRPHLAVHVSKQRCVVAMVFWEACCH